MLVSEAPAAIWPLALYFVLVILLAAAMIGLSYVLGEHHRDRAKNSPYESGVVSFGSARLHISAKFYLVALFFVIFDLEAVFIYAWAVALHDAGWTGYTVMAIFITIQFAALVYLWRLGALDWSSHPAARKARHAR